MKKNYRIADHVIEIDSVYDYIHKMCKEYATEEKAELFVKTAVQDCENERTYSDDNDIKPDFGNAYLETLAVYRKIANQLIYKDVILFHGSAVAVDGECFLFTAKSGTGKSTHTANWRKYFGERAVMVNDDKPLIHITEEGAFIFGTPWNGKHHLSTNICVPLKAICILTRDNTNHIEKTDHKSAYSMILQQTNRQNKPEDMKKTLELIDKLIKNVSLYKLGCNMDIESAEIAYNGMKG